MVDHCNLIDLGYTGPPFAWTNKREPLGLIKERIDRVWMNAEWRSIFPDSRLFHLPIMQSDHCPLLLDLDHTNAIPNKKIFRLEVLD